MSVVMLVYTPSAFGQYLLPAIDNADTQIVLKRTAFDFVEDVILKLEVVENRWYLKESEQYVYKKTKEREEDFEFLENGDVISLFERHGREVRILIQEMESSFMVPQKYDLSSSAGLYIGSDPAQCHIAYQYHQYVSKMHAFLKRTEDGFAIEGMSANGTFVNGRCVKGTQQLQMGDVINIFGLKIVYLGDVIAVSSLPGFPFSAAKNVIPYTAVSKPKPDEATLAARLKKYFHRSPRKYMQPETDAIEIEAPPAEKQADKKPLWMIIGPSFTMMLPMLAGSGMMIYSTTQSGGAASPFMFTGIITAGGSAIIGVFWALSNLKYSKKELKEASELRYRAYADYLVKRADYIKEQYNKSRMTLLAMYPPAELVAEYSEESSELWNRNAKHEDFLSHRVGSGSKNFQMNIQVPKERFTLINDELAEKPQEIKKEFETLYDVPLNIDLLKNKLIGIVGGTDKKGAYSIVRTLTAQIAASNCYTDVKLVYVYDQDYEEEDWEYTKWLPHVWSEDKKVRYVASNRKEASDIFFELTQILRMRAEEDDGRRRKGYIPKPYYILFVSDMELLNGELITKYMVDGNAEYGLTSIILAESVDQLPNECEFVLQNDEYNSCIQDLSVNETIQITFDDIDNDRLLRFARRLLPVEVKEMERGRDIPEAINFFEMHGVKNLNEFKVEDRWRKNRNYENMRAMIGVKGGGSPCYLDVHEKYHGPHGLVAGTTGSGKSETLQTYMLSLAIEFSPDDVGFFIIDYKGGGMAGLFDGLPHMIGSISNLSGNQVRRAMVSIKSENRRRQRIFTENNVNNINLYTRLYKNGQASVPIPHLFIIIDEFAELKREEPEFMKELISVAQVGRSLGVHLILATQKPSGTVDDNIWSNSKFRLCLRVQDRQDSKDMLHKPDAAFITQAGRGYLQVGNDEVYELFQSGYSGAPYVEMGEDEKADIAIMVSSIGREAYVSGNKKSKKNDNAKSVTQLEAVISYLGAVAREEGYDHQMQLWMPLLPEYLYLSALEGYKSFGFDGSTYRVPEGKWRLDTVIGLCDDPVNQAQFPLVIDFAENGHLAVMGSIVSGKSTFLQSLLYALMQQYRPDWLNMYILDFSSQMQVCFENAPHVGDVMLEDDTEKIAKFFHMMERIMAERKKLFRGGNYIQYAQVNGVKVPAIIIAVDNYGAFREKTDCAYDDKMLRIAKEGVGYGIYLVLTASGFTTSEIPMKMGDNIKTVVALQMNDRFAYSDVTRQMHLEVLPESNVKGRGLAVVNDVPLEFQTALSLQAEDDFTRGEKIKEELALLSQHWTGRKARAVPVIPEKPVWSEFEKLDEVQALASDPYYLPIGYDSSSADVYSINLSKTYTYLVSGKARTGKTTVLKALIRSCVAKNGKVVVFETDGQELKLTAEKTGARYISTAEEQAKFFVELVEPFKKRNKLKRELLESGKDEGEIFDAMQSEEPYFLIVADMTAFVTSIYKDLGVQVPRVSPFVENIAEKGKLHNVFFFIGINPDNVGAVLGKKVYDCMVGFRTGIHLGGNVSSLRYFDYSHLPFTMQSKPTKPGVGLLPAGNEDSVVQVVLPNVKG